MGGYGLQQGVLPHISPSHASVSLAVWETPKFKVHYSWVANSKIFICLLFLLRNLLHSALCLSVCVEILRTALPPWIILPDYWEKFRGWVPVVALNLCAEAGPVIVLWAVVFAPPTLSRLIYFAVKKQTSAHTIGCDRSVFFIPGHCGVQIVSVNVNV